MRHLYYQKFDKNQSFFCLEFEGVLPIYVLEWKYHALMTEALLVKAALKIEKV